MEENLEILSTQEQYAANREAAEEAEARTDGIKRCVVAMAKKVMADQLPGFDPNPPKPLSEEERRERYQKRLQAVAEAGANMAVSTALWLREGSGPFATQDCPIGRWKEDAVADGKWGAKVDMSKLPETVDISRDPTIDKRAACSQAARKFMAVADMECFDAPQTTILDKVRVAAAYVICYIVRKVFVLGTKVARIVAPKE